MVTFKRQNPKKRNTEEKRVRTISSSKADTSGTRWSMSVDASLAGVSFLSHKGVLKERCKTERVMKTSTAPFFSLKQTHKQTKHHTCETDVSKTIHIFRANGILE